MSINERIRFLRKEHLHKNQTDFSKAIGMKQTGLSFIEQDGATVKDQVIKNICLTFNISEDWLRYGKGPMEIKAPTFSLDDFVKSKGATDLELEIVKAYFDIEPDTRKMLVEHFKNRLSAYSGELLREEVPSDPEEFEAQYPPIPDDESEAG